MRIGLDCACFHAAPGACVRDCVCVCVSWQWFKTRLSLMDIFICVFCWIWTSTNWATSWFLAFSLRKDVSYFLLLTQSCISRFDISPVCHWHILSWLPANDVFCSVNRRCDSTWPKSHLDQGRGFHTQLQYLHATVVPHMNLPANFPLGVW